MDTPTKRASSQPLKNSKVPPILGVETIGTKDLFKAYLKSRLREGLSPILM